MAFSNIDKILEKIPYSDGSFRRRLVSGCIVLIGLLVLFCSGEIASFINGSSKFDAKDLLTSPIIAGTLLLLVYAIGNLVEMIGEVFLVKGAAGLYSAFSYPAQSTKQEKYYIFHFIGVCAYGLYVPFLMARNMIKSFLGYKTYEIKLKTILNKDAMNLCDSFPDSVVSGLSAPVGNDAEIAWKYIVDQFKNESDQKWARRFISRAKDVLAITTSLVIVFFISILVLFNPFKDRNQSAIPMDNIKNEIKEYNDSIVNFCNSQDTSSLSVEKSKFLDNLKTNLSEYKIQINLNTSKDPYGIKILKKTIAEKVSKLEKFDSEKAIDDKLLNTAKYSLGNIDNALKKWHNNQSKIYNYTIYAIYAVSPFIMLLYFAYFLTLRNVIVSILEVLAIKEDERGCLLTFDKRKINKMKRSSEI